MLALGGAIVVGGLNPGDPPQIGPYRLLGELGGGGMGRVFLGLSAGGRPVAVKVIRPELAADLEFRVRFGREVAAAQRVSGLFTALVVDADVDGPVPWLATAYVHGPSLAEAVTGCGPLPARPTLALAAGLAEGLSAIHAAGLVHCDLKPSNVLLSQDGPRVIDFGVSRAAEPVAAAGAGLVVGSAGFMSPEQAMGQPLGPSSDIFSLGAVLTFAATGEGPFGHGSRPELAYRLVYRPPRLDPLPAELRPLVERCLAKDPGQRPTADDVLAEASRAQASAGWLPEAGQARSPGWLPGMAAAAPAPRTPAPPDPPPASQNPPDLPPVSQNPAGRPPASQNPHVSRRARRPPWWRPLAAAGVTAGVLAVSVAVSFVLDGADGPSSGGFVPPRGAPHASARPAPRSSAHASGTHPAAPGSRLPSTSPVPGVMPAVHTVTSPAPPDSTSRPPATSPPASPHRSTSPTASPSATASASPAPSPSPSSSPSSSASSTPSSSTSSSPPVPQVTRTGTYRQGTWVYFEVDFADPGRDAQGLGFAGVNGARPVAGTVPFSSPGPAIVGTDTVAYPLDLECGTAGQHEAEVRAWIYDAAGAASRPVVINLACPAGPGAPPSPGDRGANVAAATAVPTWTIRLPNIAIHRHLRARTLLLPCPVRQQKGRHH